MLTTLLLTGLTLSAEVPEVPRDRVSSEGTRFNVTAKMAAAELSHLQRTNTFTVQVEVDEENAQAFGWHREEPDASVAFRHPIIELDLPDSVELIGGAPNELIAPEDYVVYYLDAPYGRRMLTPEVGVEFRLIRTPRPGDTIGINVTAYLGEGDSSTFVRRRLELPVVAGAEARPGDPNTSSWGRKGHYAIGDKVEDFTLPTVDGEEVRLSDLLAEGDLLITTYRAYW